MAFTRAASSDTDASVQERAYGTIKGVSPVSPLTAEVTPFSSPRPGRSNLTFGSGNVDDPGRVSSDENLAPLRTTNISGRQGSTGNPLGDALQKQLKKLSPLVADQIRTALDNAAVRQGFGELDANLISAQSDAAIRGGFGQLDTNLSSVPDSIAFGGGLAGVAGGFTGATPGFGVGATSFIPGFNEGGFIRKRT